VITHLTGTLLEKNSTSIAVGVGGIGFGVGISLYTYARLPEVGQKVSLYTHLLVREDALLLYGFYDHVEREFFSPSSCCGRDWRSDGTSRTFWVQPAGTGTGDSGW